MCFGRQPKIVMPKQPVLHSPSILKAPDPPAAPKAPARAPEPVSLRDDVGHKSVGLKPKKKKTTRGTTSLRVPLNVGNGGLNV